MPYEIPAEIEYKEKIVFGLTFKQLIIVVPFLLLVALIFKTNLNIYAKSIVSAFILGLAGLFMFFELGGKIKTFINWKKNIPSIGLKILQQL